MALNKHAAIATLYKEGWEQKDIAKVLKLSEVTISRHVSKQGLKKKRAQMNIARQTSEENALSALEYQSTIVKLMSDKLRDTLPDEPNIDELKAALLPKGEIDALQKLFTTVKSKEMEWSAVVRIIREFTTWLKEEDMRLAQEIIDFADVYINEKRRLMQ